MDQSPRYVGFPKLYSVLIVPYALSFHCDIVKQRSVNGCSCYVHNCVQIYALGLQGLIVSIQATYGTEDAPLRGDASASTYDGYDSYNVTLRQGEYINKVVSTFTTILWL